MKVLKYILKWLIFFGFDYSRFRSLKFLPRYLFELREFKKQGGKVTQVYPILYDYFSPAGDTKTHYFHQDLLVAQYVFDRDPKNHVDIGSRIDGFVAHLASFRDVTVLDIRPNPEIGHSRIRFEVYDVMNPEPRWKELADSVSCLNAIEHFGLGRYGDNLNPEGHKLGFQNLVNMLTKTGKLYISFPIGKENTVYFNAHRVFHPQDIFTWIHDFQSTLSLESFDFVDDDGVLHRDINIDLSTPLVNYGCGIYTFTKLK